MCNLLEYSDNYADSSVSMWQFKRDEENVADDGNPADVTTDDSSCFKYKSDLLGNLAASAAGANGVLENGKLVVPLKYLSIFFRSLEMPLINCKLQLELSWTNNSVMSNTGGATKI